MTWTRSCRPIASRDSWNVWCFKIGVWISSTFAMFIFLWIWFSKSSPIQKYKCASCCYCNADTIAYVCPTFCPDPPTPDSKLDFTCEMGCCKEHGMSYCIAERTGISCVIFFPISVSFGLFFLMCDCGSEASVSNVDSFLSTFTRSSQYLLLKNTPRILCTNLLAFVLGFGGFSLYCIHLSWEFFSGLFNGPACSHSSSH